MGLSIRRIRALASQNGVLLTIRLNVIQDMGEV